MQSTFVHPTPSRPLKRSDREPQLKIHHGLFTYTYTTETKVHKAAFNLAMRIFRRGKSVPCPSEGPWLDLKVKLTKTD